MKKGERAGTGVRLNRRPERIMSYATPIRKVTRGKRSKRDTFGIDLFSIHADNGICKFVSARGQKLILKKIYWIPVSAKDTVIRSM